MKIVIRIRGGLVTSVATSEDAEVAVVDFDNEGVAEEELTPITDAEGNTEDAYVYCGGVQYTSKEEVENIFKQIYEE